MSTGLLPLMSLMLFSTSTTYSLGIITYKRSYQEMIKNSIFPLEFCASILFTLFVLYYYAVSLINCPSVEIRDDGEVTSNQ